MSADDEGGSLREPPVAEVLERDGAVIVRLSGELDLHNAGDVRTALERATQTGAARIVVDLSRVEFLDSTLLGVLVEARRRTADAAAFRLAAPGRSTRRMLQVAGVEGYLDVHDTVDDALR